MPSVKELEIKLKLLAMEYAKSLPVENSKFKVELNIVTTTNNVKLITSIYE